MSRPLTVRHMAVRKIRNWWWVDFRFEGERFRKKSPENSKNGAQAYEARLRNRVARGESLDWHKKKEQEPTFAEFSQQWFDTYVKANLKPSAQRTYASILRVHLVPAFGKRRLADISGSQVEHLKAKKLNGGLSAKRINNILTVLSSCLSAATEWGVLEAKPRQKLLKYQQTNIDFLNDEEVGTLIKDTSEPTWNVMVRLAVRSGMRIGELLALQWRDIDLSRSEVSVSRSVTCGIITATKSNRIRHIPLTSDAVVALRTLDSYLHSSFVFPSAKSSEMPLSYAAALRALDRICRRVNIRKIGWHTLRHTFASSLVMKGVPIYSVMKLLGHSSISMTERYAHLAPAALRNAIAVLELEATH